MPGDPAAIVVPVGSGGSAAGLLAGLAAEGLDIPVVGVSVSRQPEAVRAHVLDLAAQCAALCATPPPRPDQLTLVDAREPGFGLLTDREQECAARAYTRAGLLLDATYGAKTLRVALDRATGTADPVLWWHTGGLVPATTRIGKSV